ncbi:Fat-like cadherin-related tumor suppressor-like protein [Armadillidium vulgare]|nr:Fat-like cadherin-related tumor suppressor-like protein [Armadillidium vulgare]
MSFVSPLHEHTALCVCPPGYSGRVCETIINQCAHNPCPPYQICVPKHSKIGYMCMCNDDLVGATCSMKKADCIGKELTPQCYTPLSPMTFGGKSFIQYLLQMPIERHLKFSLWIKTLHPSGNLMFTSGRLDYSILELENGHARFRWDLGSGEGIVSVSSLRVDDGLWHLISIERIENTVTLSIDDKWRSEGSSPGSSEILNLESHHLYLGAEVRPWTGAGKNPRHGFVGCIDNARLENSPLPLTHSPSNSVAALMRLSFVTAHCYGQLKPPGLCGTHPCLNGGTCEERDNSFICECDSRFKGPHCEVDLNPCASSPCLNNGHCVNERGSYRCECPAQVSGPRCQFMYCNPNPCLNKGICEEGISGPICKCRGFTGAYCNVDINECEKNPCEEGGTCINTYGGFKCMCPRNFTGSYCDIPAAVSAFPVGFTEIIYIVIGILCLVVIAVLVIAIMHCREKQISRRRERMEQNHVILNSKTMDNHHHNMYKRNSKVSNIEASQSCTTRPESFPLSPISEPVYAPLNNFDTIRSYGSAGDELENLPQYSRDFVHNITKVNSLHNQNRNPSVSNSSTGISRASSGSGFMPQVSFRSPESDSLHKPWKEALGLSLKDAYYEAGKIPNDVKFNHEYLNLKKISGGNEAVRHLNPVRQRDDSSVRSGASEEDMQEYHWDCSDWARPSQNPLPNIQEVPGGEIRDSSSYQSNESNESIVVKSEINQTFMPPSSGPVNPTRDMETLPADEFASECGTDFDLESRTDLDTSHILDHSSDIDVESDTSLFIPQPHRYETHPNQYLPRYHINSETETDDEKGKLLNTSSRSPYRKRTNILRSPSNLPLLNNSRLPPVPQPVSSQTTLLPTASNTKIYHSPPTGYLRNNRRLSNTIKRTSLPAHDDDEVEGISLFGAASNTSASDIDNVCDIDDSEVNSEFENDK